MISIVVTTDIAGIMSYKGNIPWYIPEERQWFYNVTVDNIVMMGYNTWHNIIKIPLPKRKNIVLSHNHYEKTTGNNGPFFFPDLNSILEVANRNICIIGGEKLFRTVLQKDIVDQIFITVIKNLYRGDKYFPREFLNRYHWETSLIIETTEFYITCYDRILNDKYRTTN